MFLYTRHLQIILCKLRRLEVVFPSLFFNDCELRQENNVPIFSSPFPLLLFFFSLYKFVTWHALSGLFLKFWGHTTFVFLSHGLPLCAFFRLCGFDDPTCFPVDETFSCYRVSCLWFHSGGAQTPVARAATFCTVVPNVCRFSLRNLLCVILTAPRIMSWLLYCWKMCSSLFSVIY